TERPKPVVIITPGTHVFRGENVTFKCELQGGDTEWTYSWHKNNNRNPPFSTAQEVSRVSVTDSDSGEYTCSGRRHSDSQSSEISDPVTLTVSEKPEPELTSDLKGAALTGNSVTLYCTLKLQSAGWKFYWRKYTQWPETETETHFYTIRSVSVSDGGQYWCRAGKGNPVYSTHYSNELWVNVIESPKPVVIIKPETQVFSGETVTFGCEIQRGKDTEWNYDWYKDDNTLDPKYTTQEFSISSVPDSSRGKYTCRGRRRSDNQISKTSDSVTLTVSEKPKTELTSDLKGAALTGNAVTLYCTLKLQSAGWKFYWKKDEQSHETETETHSYTIRPVSVSDEGQYRCRAGRGNPVYYTHYSDALWVNVTDKSASVSLIINPSRSQHFTADSLSLSCEDQRDSTGWTVRRYTHSEASLDCSSVSGSTCNISSLSPSHTGVYWCQSESGERSDSVNITVHKRPKPVVIITPGTHVFSGEKVTFKCELQEGDTEWTYSWYKKDNRNPPFSTTQEFNRDSVTDSDSGEYTCSGRRHSDSQSSEISDPVTLTVSEKPKPVLTSNLQEVLTGNSVTLNCTLNLQSKGWKFYWRKHTQSRETESKQNHYSIRSVSVSDGGQYWCRAGRGNPVYYTRYSDALSLKVTESPKPVVKIQPDTHVFMYERVTFRCEFQGEGDSEWIYDWYRDDRTFYTYHTYYPYYPYYTHHPYFTTQEFSISYITDSSRGKYTCRGRRHSDNQISQTSDSVTLTVSERPKPVVKIHPAVNVFIGETVTLTCDIQTGGSWKYHWYRSNEEIRAAAGKKTYTITDVKDSNKGPYSCKGTQSSDPKYTQSSDAVTLTVAGESPLVSLIINPSRSQHFTADSLSLSCEDQRDSTGWTVRRYTLNQTTVNCSSVSGSTCNISSLSPSHTGVYWCQSESGERSDSVNITVHNGDVILDSPAHPVTEGNPLTLRCLYHNTNISHSVVHFYKYDSVLQNQTTGVINISSVSKSDEGFY
ncbi:sialoadhesin-like, partial [Silurus asotus]